MTNAYEDLVNLCTKGEKMREFDTGATRDSDDSKIDYEGILSPRAIRRYGEYMNKHRIQADGKLRDSDNWQKGIPLAAYMKSLWRHLMELWTRHRIARFQSGWTPEERFDVEDALCAIIFNASGYLHEIMKPKGITEPSPPTQYGGNE